MVAAIRRGSLQRLAAWKIESAWCLAMPVRNQFAHQSYSARRPTAPYELLSVDPVPKIGSPEYRTRMQAVAHALERANVGAVILVHGTFVGEDPWGLSAMLLGRHHAWHRKVCRWQKGIADRVMRDRGNFPPQYVAQLTHLLGDSAPLSVDRFLWSGMNNHAGRALAAINLHGYLCDLNLPVGKRIVLCGHSHGGNVLALLTNLLAADQMGVSEFLQTVGEYARTFDASWEKCAQRVLDGSQLAKEHPLDVVTFGMPIRYGFETTGYANLLHFVNHRPGKLRAEYRVAGPISFGEMLSAYHGDYIHEVGIAGSNFSTPLSRPLWKCDKRLAAQLAPDLPWTKLPRRIALGMRVPEEGRTLLVDYGRPGGRWWRSGMGHAEYTHFERMLFHFEQLAQRFYPKNIA